MYARKVTVRASDGTPRQYLRIQESYRVPLPGGGRSQPRQRVLANLGRVDLLAPHAKRLYQLLTGELPDAKAARDDSMDAWDWGPLLVLRALWDDHLQLDRILRRLGRGPRDPGGRELAERAFALVANRLLDPSSEHGLAYWLDAAYVCDDRGRRWLPQWRDDAQRKASKTPRVMVEFQWLQRWYRTLDRLVRVKEALEVELFEQLRTLFEVQVELALYDITSTYFEGHGPPELARHGHSRDQRPRERQIVLGLVLIDGWPIAHHVFAGNRKDASTVAEVVQDLKQRFGLQRIVFVGDRGMIDDAVREELDAAGCGYLMGLSRRHNADVKQLLAEARRTPPEDWAVVPGPATQAAEAASRVLEVGRAPDGPRRFAVYSPERQAWEQQQRERERERLRTALERLQERVRKGQLKREGKIAAAAERLLQKHHGRRHFEVQAGPGKFAYAPSARAAGEDAGEGHYFLETTEARLSAVEVVQEYKRLGQVESCFAQLKDVIELRPIWHRTAERVRGHVQVAALALLLQRMLERRLKEAGEDLSANAALRALQTIRVVEFETVDGERKRVVTQASERARKVLKALKIKKKPPPGVPTLASETAKGPDVVTIRK